jgi:hypothetical protein
VSKEGEEGRGERLGERERKNVTVVEIHVTTWKGISGGYSH